MNRIKELRKEKGMTLDELGNALSISRATLNRYENEDSEPKKETWQCIAKYFGESVAYIMGVEDLKTNRIKELRLQRNETLENISLNTGIPKSSLNEYENTPRQPKRETWQKLADYFNVSVPYLMGIDETNDNMISIPVDEYNRLKELERKHEYIKSLLLDKE